MKSGPSLTRLLDEALAYASEAHRLQVRKGSEVPYVAHLVGVASIALEAAAEEDQAVAALLHDSVEGQGGQQRLEGIRTRFGERVARNVQDCSDSNALPKLPWKERKQAYIANPDKKSANSLLISICDKLYNAEAVLSDLLVLGDELWGRFIGEKDGTLWYYEELARAFERLFPGSLSEKLSRKVADIRAHARPE
jgi:(p)ppGpp synthase/HD superfamily hydrolase